MTFGVAALVAAAVAQPILAADDDLGWMSGKWAAVEGKSEGKPLSKDELGRFKIVLSVDGKKVDGRTGWQLLGIGGAEGFQGHGIHIDAAASPMRIYVIRSIGAKATMYPGIFKRDGDRLVVCWNLEPWFSPDGPALRQLPKEFAAPKGSGFTLLVFERVKE
jgi:uncharacterized protein (TIGR03067 family)